MTTKTRIKKAKNQAELLHRDWANAMGPGGDVGEMCVRGDRLIYNGHILAVLLRDESGHPLCALLTNNGARYSNGRGSATRKAILDAIPPRQDGAETPVFYLDLKGAPETLDSSRANAQKRFWARSRSENKASANAPDIAWVFGRIVARSFCAAGEEGHSRTDSSRLFAGIGEFLNVFGKPKWTEKTWGNGDLARWNNEAKAEMRAERLRALKPRVESDARAELDRAFSIAMMGARFARVKAIVWRRLDCCINDNAESLPSARVEVGLEQELESGWANMLGTYENGKHVSMVLARRNWEREKERIVRKLETRENALNDWEELNAILEEAWEAAINAVEEITKNYKNQTDEEKALFQEELKSMRDCRKSYGREKFSRVRVDFGSVSMAYCIERNKFLTVPFDFGSIILAYCIARNRFLTVPCPTVSDDCKALYNHDGALTDYVGLQKYLNRPDTLYTSRGLEFSRSDARNVFNLARIARARGKAILGPALERISPILAKASGFHIVRIGADGSAKIGCHWFAWPVMEYAARQLGLENDDLGAWASENGVPGLDAMLINA